MAPKPDSDAIPADRPAATAPGGADSPQPSAGSQPAPTASRAAKHLGGAAARSGVKTTTGISLPATGSRAPAGNRQLDGAQPGGSGVAGGNGKVGQLAEAAGAGRLLKRSQSTGGIVADSKDTAANIKDGVAAGSRIGGMHGAAIGAGVGALAGVAKNKTTRRLAILLLVAQPLLVGMLVFGLLLLMMPTAIQQPVNQAAAGEAAQQSGVDADKINDYVAASQRSGVPWEILAAIENQAGRFDEKSAPGTSGHKPAGPFRMVREDANRLAKKYGYTQVSAAGVNDRVTAGTSLGRAFEAMLGAKDSGVKAMLLDAGATITEVDDKTVRAVEGNNLDNKALHEQVRDAYVAVTKKLPIGGAPANADSIFDTAFQWSVGQAVTDCQLSAGPTSPAGTAAGSGVWVNPLKGRVASVYGPRIHPVTGLVSNHTGEDVAAPSRADIVAASGGTVIHVGYLDRWYGNEVAIDHGNGVTTHYRHLWDDTMYVKEGQQVRAGERIAGVGSTGTSTGPHLHLEVHISGQPTDPTQFLKERGVILGSSSTKPPKSTGIAEIGANAAVSRQGSGADGGAPSAVPVGITTAGGPLSARDANGTAVTLNSNQLAHAATWIGVGESLRLDQNSIKAGLVTVLQESRLKVYANSNVPESLTYPHEAVGSDHNSVGLAQQRPPSWGSVKQLMDPSFSARMFFGGPTKPKKDGPPGLLDIPGYQTMPPGRLAQKVQVSAFPDAYDKWVPVADTILGTVKGVSTKTNAPGCGTPATTTDNGPAGSRERAAIEAAKTQLGVDYSLGGGDLTKPSAGFSGVVGWDCSSLVRYAYYTATDGRLVLPRTTYDQPGVLTKVTDADMRAGDLVFFDTMDTYPQWSHVGLYLGGGKMIHAPRTGKTVEIVDITTGYYKRTKHQAMRIPSTTKQA